MTLTKSQIIDAVVASNGFSINKAADTVEAVLKIIKQGLESGDDVLVSGFGKFQVRQKAARKGRNPYTGESMMLKPRRVVTFKCSGKLKERINGSENAGRGFLNNSGKI
ncbi:Integration host factor alpha subunit [Olavius sp. associated proteobacterium Delta 1]|nr:Integration host factor alpha subunit [Olavius sp. associated proteobacterium Delta 1]